MIKCLDFPQLKQPVEELGRAGKRLPGIAGMVLTLGMAVDANVLIYERTKEELRAGKSLDVYKRQGRCLLICSLILTSCISCSICFGCIGSGDCS